MAPRGRPSKYTPERVKRITDALAAGNSRKAAAAYGGITDDTLNAWVRNYSDFSDAVKSAEAQAEVGHVANIAQAARSGTWQASAWWLERRRRDEWGRRVTLDLAHEIRDLVHSAGLGDDVADEAVAEAQDILKRTRRGAGS
jgi:transposase